MTDLSGVIVTREQAKAAVHTSNLVRLFGRSRHSYHNTVISGDLGRLDPGELLMLTLTQMSPSKRALLGARNAKEVLDAGITSARVLGHSGIDGDVALRDAI